MRYSYVATSAGTVRYLEVQEKDSLHRIIHQGIFLQRYTQHVLKHVYRRFAWYNSYFKSCIYCNTGIVVVHTTCYCCNTDVRASELNSYIQSCTGGAQSPRRSPRRLINYILSSFQKWFGVTIRGVRAILTLSGASCPVTPSGRESADHPLTIATQAQYLVTRMCMTPICLWWC